MGPEHLIAFNLTLLAAIASPGPSLLYLIRTTLADGRRNGMLAGCGLASMAAIWTLTALMGLDGLFRLFPWAYLSFKIAGALYLLYIAWTTWRHARRPLSAAPARPGHRAFLSGVLVNMANPKSVLFAAAVLVVIFPRDLAAADKALIFANHLAVEMIVQPLLAVLLSTAVIRNRYLGAKPVLDRIAATVLGALGLRLLADR